MPLAAVIAALAVVPAVTSLPIRATNPPSMAVQVNGRVLAVQPLERIPVKGEEHVMGGGQPNHWFGGVSPKFVLGPVDVGTRLPQALEPGSVTVRSRDGKVYAEGKDYVLDTHWGGLGRVRTGEIKADQPVLIDYTVSRQRIDTVQISKDGTVSIKKGEAARVCPAIPEVDRGCKRLANIFLPFNATSVTQGNIYAIDDPKLTWQRSIRIEGRGYLAGTRRLLAEGKPVKIVCYGDSVTAGGSASSKEKTFVGSLKPELLREYPKAQIEVVNAGIGGSSTPGRLPNMDKEVLSFNPDLITVEFINDWNLPVETLKANYTQLIDRARTHNPKVEIILLTPHFVRPDWYGNFDRYRETLRQIAREKKVGLGDTANIWAGLRKVGIPYQTLLANEINHPNDLGHRFFVETILAFF